MKKNLLLALFLAAPFLSHAEMGKDTICIISGVPVQLWYQNCGITCHTMIAGYYSRSYPDILPGGGAKNITAYRALADVLCYTNETHDQYVPTEPGGISNGLRYYLYAPEYGLEIPSTLKPLPFGSFEDYVKAIDTYKCPLYVGWHDEPYGAHATVGIGYQVKAGKGYLVLYDTWVDRPVYISYEEHKEAMDNELTVLTIDGPGLADRSDKEWPLAEGLALERENLPFSPALTDRNIRNVVQADLDTDGRLELLMADFNYFANPKLGLYSSDFVYNKRQLFEYEKEYNIFSKLRLADLDDDSYQDLIATGYWCNTHLFKGKRGGFEPVPRMVSGSDYRGYLDLAVMNVDQDASPEIVMSSVDGKLCFAQGGKSLDYSISGYHDFKSHLTRLEAIDLDRDGHLDLVASLRSGTVLAYYYRNGQLEEEPSFRPEGHGGIALAVGDVDKDGYPDIIGLDDRAVVLYKNNAGRFSDDPVRLETPNGTPMDLMLEDLTGDGYPELVVSNLNFRDYILGNTKGELGGVLWRSRDNSATFGSTLLDVKGKPCIAFYKGYGKDLDVWSYTPTATGIEDITDGTTIRYLPSGKQLRIETDLPGECVIMDFAGKVFARETLPAGVRLIDMSRYASSAAIVVYTTGFSQKTLKIIL